MNRLFYIIYNSYYKNGEYKNDIPSLTVGGIFLICFFCIRLSVLAIMELVNPPYHHTKTSSPTVMLEMIVYGILVYFLFYHNKRYQRIYEKYKENVFLNSKIAKFLGFCTVILIIVFPFILGVVSYRVVSGHWMTLS
ncbi:hypothetical protein BC624_101427 [Flavobacterium granuli]|uniref:Uncharacterized protein n=1 Tax=Flavobacterium granuli TaxID=280093 RepID=A0A1M5IWZ9_9FLAO|nr:hypothetical protein BC624_101427 [Flavobacterium granuli]SHG32645.1 hypothetical protein SAMN05443373_101427 [Flavobacterium granuli]